MQKEPPPPKPYDTRWRTQWRDSKGKQRWKTFGYRDRMTAGQAYTAYLKWLAEEWVKPEVAEPGRILTVEQLCTKYLVHARKYYVDQDRRQTGESRNIAHAVGHLRGFMPDAVAHEVGVSELREMRGAMIADNLSRNVINQRVNKIVAMYRWAAEHEMLPEGRWRTLSDLQPLRLNRSEARETKPVVPVPRDHIDAVLAACPGVTATLIRLQLLTAMRPGEVVRMRGVEIDTSELVWWYRPEYHKNKWRGRGREIPLGPEARRLIKLSPGYLFPPEPVAVHREVGPHITVNSYLQRVYRACDRAGVPRWSPGRLRHNALTEIRRVAGLEAAQFIAGHAKPNTTEIYAEKNRQLAADVAGKIG